MKRICTLLVLMALSTQLFSQKTVAFGLKGGLNLSTISNLDRGDARPGFHVGGLLHIRLNSKWRLQPELYFSTQGKSSGKSTVDEDYNYIVFPVLLQYRFTGRFFVEAGPQLGVLVNPKRRDYPDQNGQSFTNRHENIGDFLVAAGAGYEFTRRFGAYARYNQGLMGIRRSSDAPKQYNQVVQVGVAVKF